VTHCDHLVQLDNFDQEVFGALHVEFWLAGLVSEAIIQCLVVRSWQYDSREEILSNILVKWEIETQELGQVDIVDGSKHEFSFILIWVGLLEVTCSCDDRLYSSHSVIIMLLCRKLL
jgi:hypothetical protein